MRLVRMAVVTAVAATGAATAGCGLTGPSSQADLVNQTKKGTVRIEGKIGDATVGGTGIVIDAEKGQILTNAHVIAGASSLKANYGSKKVSLRVDGQSPCDDLAVATMRPNIQGLQALPLADSEAVQSGDPVTAVGYPAGLGERPTRKVVATQGTVSAIDLSAQPSDDLPRYSSLIQHQASINPGNSGGPLVNESGELIGVNTLGSGGDQQGQFYSIASNFTKEVLPDLQAGKDKDFIGWNVVPSTLGEEYGISKENTSKRDAFLNVVDVESGSPADKAKPVEFTPGDFIDAIEGTKTKDVQDVCDAVQSKGSGDTLKIQTSFFDRRNELQEYEARLKLK